MDVDTWQRFTQVVVRMLCAHSSRAPVHEHEHEHTHE
jgi:hypothetical protein